MSFSVILRSMFARVRTAARQSPLYGPYVQWKYRAISGAHRSYFEGMYEQNIWGDRESRSGSASNLKSTERLRAELPALLRDLGVRSLLDIPCGDWVWMQHVDLSTIEPDRLLWERPVDERADKTFAVRALAAL
jgi:hypothetical protein